MYITNRKFLHLLALCSAILYLIELKFVFSLTPEGYSVNIYNQIGFKIIFLNIVVYGFCLVLLTTRKNKIITSSTGAVLLLNYLTLMITPNLLGYYVTDRGDTLCSVGLARYVIKTGHTDPLDIYPMAFIESAILYNISNVKTPWITVSLLASLLFVLGILALTYLFLKEVASKNRAKYLIPTILCVSVPYYLGMYHTSFIAQYITFTMESIFLLSFFLYIFRGSTGFLISSLVLAIFSVLGHPILGVFNIYFMLTFIIFSKMYNFNTFRVNGILKITFIVLFFWFAKVGLLKQYVLTLQTIFETNFRIYSQVIELSKEAKITFIELLKYIFIRYGDQILLYLMSLSFIVYIIRTRLYTNIKILIILAGFILSNIFVVALILFPLVKQNYNRVLGLNLGIYFTIVVVGTLLLKTLEKKRYQKFLCFMLFVIYIVSVMGLFLSPFMGYPFIGIANNEISGITFMFTHQDLNYKIVDLIGEAGRYSIWYYGYSETFRQNRVLYMCKLPDHFGYPEVRTIKDNHYLIKVQYNTFQQSKVPYKYSRLLIPIAKYMIEPYEKISTFRSVHRWAYGDLVALRCDPTADVIYTGKDLIIVNIP